MDMELDKLIISINFTKHSDIGCENSARMAFVKGKQKNVMLNEK